MDNGNEDVKALTAENLALKKALKDLTVDKNMMELKLFKAFNKLLSTKKRKIKRLERALKKLNGNQGALSDEEDNHCDTCKCRNRRRIERQCISREVEENADSDVTMDPGVSDYGSETDIDEDIPSSSNNANQSSSVHNSVRMRDTTTKTNLEEATEKGQSGNNHKVVVEQTTEKTGTGSNEQETSTQQSDPNSQSDYEMDNLVDDLINS